MEQADSPAQRLLTATTGELLDVAFESGESFTGYVSFSSPFTPTPGTTTQKKATVDGHDDRSLEVVIDIEVASRDDYSASFSHTVLQSGSSRQDVTIMAVSQSDQTTL